MLSTSKVVEREDIKDAIAKKEQELEQVDEAFKPKIEAEIEVLNGRIGEINENIVNLSSFQPETGLPSKETESPAFETDATEAAQPIELSVNEEVINTQQNEQTTPQEGSAVEGELFVSAKPKPIDEESIAASKKWIKDLYSLPESTRIQDKNGNVYDIKNSKIRKITLS